MSLLVVEALPRDVDALDRFLAVGDNRYLLELPRLGRRIYLSPVPKGPTVPEETAALVRALPGRLNYSQYLHLVPQTRLDTATVAFLWSYHRFADEATTFPQHHATAAQLKQLYDNFKLRYTKAVHHEYLTLWNPLLKELYYRLNLSLAPKKIPPTLILANNHENMLLLIRRQDEVAEGHTIFLEGYNDQARVAAVGATHGLQDLWVVYLVNLGAADPQAARYLG